MLGQSKYGFSLGTVTITNTDPDGFAPNDADLQSVRNRMETGHAALHFMVGELEVEIDVDPATVVKQAVKPLQSKDVKPDHTPNTRRGLLG